MPPQAKGLEEKMKAYSNKSGRVQLQLEVNPEERKKWQKNLCRGSATRTGGSE
jgi:hypothetical protein